MTLPRVIANYGGPYIDEKPVRNPQTEQSAAYGNKSLEDLAQLSRTTIKAIVQFPTTASAAPVAVTATAGQCHNGTGSGSYPTISKTGTGVYVVTYPSTWTNALSVVENVSFTFGDASVMGSTAAAKPQISISGPVITVNVFNTSFAASDLGGGVTIQVWVL
jgi:hypothetical protein